MRRTALLCLAAALSPGAASAHLVGVEFGDFYAGALHVATGVAYGATLLALALTAGLQPRESGRWALVAAPPALLLGALAGSLGVVGAAPPLDPAVTATLALGGALAALNARPGPWGVAAFAGLVGGAMGAANGQAALGGGVDPLLFSLGVTAAGSVAVILGVACARAAADRIPVMSMVWRVAGSWLAAAGAASLALTVAQAAGV